MYEEKYIISDKAKKTVFTIIGVGAVLFVIGILGLMTHFFEGGSHEAHSELVNEIQLAEHHEAGAHGAVATQSAHVDGHGHYSVWTRLKADFWMVSIFFTVISVIGVFFTAIQYITWAGWSAVIVRIFMSFGYFIPVGALFIIATYFIAGHDLFHWTHTDLYATDSILAGKADYLNQPFFIGRMLLYFVLWFGFFLGIRKLSEREDEEGGIKNHDKLIFMSAAFVLVFGVTSSTSAWDWIMSIDTHWFSTMFGWYVFASSFVSGLAALTLVIVLLKQAGYLKIVNSNHLHDMGKFVFAFSIFWSYIWFCQFILYWYSNVPEESVYFIERFFNNGGVYRPIVILTLVINFLFPFLFFMTRDSKRNLTWLKVGSVVILVGHWLDFYQMIMPGILKEHGGLDLGTVFIEGGLTTIFVGIFAAVVMWALAKSNLIAKNHPMLEESVHHHI